MIYETFAKELELEIDTRHIPKIGSAVNSQYLKIIGIAKDIQSRTRLDNQKWLSFDSPAFVCSDLDDQINIGVNIMKKLEMNIQYSATGPAIFSFAIGAKQTVAKIP